MLQSGAAVPRLNAVALQQWLNSYDVDLAGGRASYILQKLDANSDQEVDVPEYVRQRLFNAGELLCHTAAEAAGASYAFSGCPCNPLQGAGLGRCPAGVLRLFCQSSLGHRIRRCTHSAVKAGQGRRVRLYHLFVPLSQQSRPETGLITKQGGNQTNHN